MPNLVKRFFDIKETGINFTVLFLAYCIASLTINDVIRQPCCFLNPPCMVWIGGLITSNNSVRVNNILSSNLSKTDDNVIAR